MKIYELHEDLKKWLLKKDKNFRKVYKVTDASIETPYSEVLARIESLEGFYE
jgi:hypothetical protein